MEPHHRLAEQDVVIIFMGAMGVKLDEEPVGAAVNPHPRFEPKGQAIDVGRLADLEIPVLDPREARPNAADSSPARAGPG